MALRNSKIILCNGIKMDKGYENVVNYTEQQLLTLCNNHKIVSSNHYQFIRESGRILVNFPYSTCLQCNYMAYQNYDYSNKWFFAWIDDIKYVNDGACEIIFSIDVFSTWFSNTTITSCLVEREHVNDDTVGLHTIPEGLEHGDYIINSEKRCPVMEDLDIVVASQLDPVLNGQGELVGGTVAGGVYNGIMNGFKYYYFLHSTSGTLKNVLKAFAEDGKSDAILNIFLAPRDLLEKVDSTITDNGQIKESSSVKYTDWAPTVSSSTYPTKLTTLDGYSPRNKKLLVYPYCYMLMSNNCGGNIVYKYEDFIDNPGYEGICYFQLSSAITPGMSIFLYPINYRKQVSNYQDRMVAGKFPICGWANDSYTNWLTQTGINEVFETIGEGVVGVLTGNLGAGVSAIANTMDLYQEMEKRSMIPYQAKGNTSAGDVITSAGLNTFTAYGMSIKSEFASLIDDYFDRFGYKVNKLKVPNITGRKYHNFVKIMPIDECCEGNIPRKYLDQLNEIFRNGVNIWHSHDNIGNYSLNNEIITE